MKFMLNAFAFCNCHLALLHKQNEINFALPHTPPHTHAPTHTERNTNVHTHSTHTTRCTRTVSGCDIVISACWPELEHFPFPIYHFPFSCSHFPFSFSFQLWSHMSWVCLGYSPGWLATCGKNICSPPATWPKLYA